MALLEFHDVSKTYGRPGRVPPAVCALTFEIEQGELALLTGPSGAGKSTVLKLILAMERPETGVIRVAGRDVHRLTRASIPYLRRNVGVVFQDFKLLADATALDNAGLPLQALGASVREVRRRAGDALSRVGLDPNSRKPVRCLSGGEQQRVALARALAVEPPLLLADEPTGNLDPDLTRDVLDALAAVRARGTTILLATHDPVVTEAAVADRRICICAGRLEEDRRWFPSAIDDVDPDTLAAADRHATAPRTMGAVDVWEAAE